VNTTVVPISDKKKNVCDGAKLLHYPINPGGDYVIGRGCIKFITDVHILTLCSVSASLEDVFAVHAR